MTLQAKLIAALIYSAILFSAGWKVCGWRVDSEALESAQKYKEQSEQLQGEVNKLSADLALLKETQKPKDKIIYKDVIRYEQIVPSERLCTLDGAWRVLHDSAATGQPADPGRLTDASSSPVKDAEALETVADNYETCRGWRRDLIEWQKFWLTVKQ